MENEITAHKAGTIKELPIKEGAAIAAGDPIALIVSRRRAPRPSSRTRSVGSAPMDYAALAAAYNQMVPFASHVGVNVDEVGPGTARVTLPEGPERMNHVAVPARGRAVHGR